MKIVIRSQDSRKFKTIEDLVWSDVPPFAVLTGLNGSGKTQLLELLAYRLAETLHPQHGDMGGIHVTVECDPPITKDGIAFLPSRWVMSSSPNLSLAEMQNIKLQTFQQFTQEHQYQNNLPWKVRKARLDRDIGRPLQKLSHAEALTLLPDDFSFMLDDIDVLPGLTYVFVGYRLRTMQLLERGKSVRDAVAELGEPPWDVLNRALIAADFPYEVLSPVGSSILDHYRVRLVDRMSKHEIDPSDVSSGEMTLLNLILWLYNTKHHKRVPQLMLLDEPDAHLHPSMARHMLDVLHKVFVQTYGVRVIMTTHSPSTVALAPEGSIFEMRRDAPRVVQSPSRAHAIGILTSGLVTVSPATRFVLAEDESDVAFYEALYQILTDYGPSRDAQALPPAPSLVFLPASRANSTEKIGGGRDVVVQWVEKFDLPPMNEIFKGVIDRDSNNAATDRIAVIGRYSIENYLLDPLLVFALLSDAGVAKDFGIPLAVSKGDEHLLRTLPNTELQQIVDSVLAVVTPKLSDLKSYERERELVKFTSGHKLQYPCWLLKRRGRDVLKAFQQCFDGPKTLTLPRLTAALSRVRLVPEDLRVTLSKLIS